MSVVTIAIVGDGEVTLAELQSALELEGNVDIIKEITSE